MVFSRYAQFYLTTNYVTKMIGIIILLIINALCSNVQATQCINSTHCKCSETLVICSDISKSDQNQNFILDIHTNDVKIQCPSEAESSSYVALSNLSIKPVPYIYFKMCPLPENVSISHIVDEIGITNFTKLKFEIDNRHTSNNLSRIHFSELTNLTELILSRSGLDELPRDLFMDMENLLRLDLRSNKLNLPNGIFDALANLEYLELGDNNITLLQLELFRNLKQLELLNLAANNLAMIPKDIFNGLSELRALDLSSNKLQDLDPDIFNNLQSLESLQITSNNFSYLPSGLFKNNKNLTTFQMFYNRHSFMALEDGLFANLTFLSDVSIVGCKLQFVPEHLFENSINIINIDLSNNNLQSIPEYLFQTQTNLKTLKIHHNNMVFIPTDLFNHLNSLEVLDLSYNYIQNITDDSFKGLMNLKELNLSNNNLLGVSNDAFSGSKVRKLINLNLANNKLTFIPPASHDGFGLISPLKDLKDLEYLNLSNNSLKSIFSDWRNTLSLKLKRLDLSYNKIKHIYKDVDLNFLSETVVDLQHNLISHIYWGDLISSLKAKIILNFNPLHCDCNSYHFADYLQRTQLSHRDNVISLETKDLYCASPENLKGIQVNSADLEKFVSPLARRGSTSKHCPSECFCELRCHDIALIVNCSHSHLASIPPLVDIEYINFTESVKPKFTELYIQGNQITKLPNLNHTGYIHVRKINAEFNNISDLSTANIPPNIEVLQLAHNNLEYIRSSVFSSIGNRTKIRKLTLGFNPWECNCKSKDLLLYMQSNYQIVEGLQNIACFGKTWSQLSIDDLCYSQHAVIIPILVVIACLGVLIGILAALYYYYQQEIKVWLFAHNLCLWFVTEEELDKDKEFDAFVSYSHKDEDFVTEHLVPNLEGCENPFKLCLHYRDWIAGEMIPTQIARSVEDSKRTVVVLSSNFLESVWGKMEFRTAHSNALTEGRARVIIIIYGDIGPLDNLDTELKAYLSTNTYLEWGDPWFWDKLRYALPHRSKYVKGKKTMESGWKKRIFEGKMDLNAPVIQNIKMNGALNGSLTSTINGSPKQNGI